MERNWPERQTNAVVQNLPLFGLRPIVLEFAMEMEKKLRKHDQDRGPLGWRESEIGYIFYGLDKEFHELRHAVGSKTENVQSEAADVANFAMMLWDMHRKIEKGSPP